MGVCIIKCIPPTNLTMYSTITCTSISNIAEAAATGNIEIDSDLNRGTDGSVVWSDKRRMAFIAAKLQGHPSQNITLVRIIDQHLPEYASHLGQPITPFSDTKLGEPWVVDSWLGGGDGKGVWKVLDGRNRLKALLDHFDATGKAEVGALQICLELLSVHKDDMQQIPQIFVSLNNGGVSLTPGEALYMTSAPTLRPYGRDSALDFARRVWEVIIQGRTGECLINAHADESIVAHALWKIRDAIHGHGSWQGQPTLVNEHPELFGEGCRKDREMGYARVLQLIQMVMLDISQDDIPPFHYRSASVLHDVALVFGKMSENVSVIGETAQMLALGSVCTNRRHNKAWLPAQCVMDMLIHKSLPQSDPCWWTYFAVFLQRCKTDPSLWIKCIVSAQHNSHLAPSERLTIAAKFAAFVRKNCVDRPLTYAQLDPELYASDCGRGC
jgi:hypothetical protein